MTSDELKQILEQTKVTPDRLAKALGVTKPAIDHWLSGRRKVPPTTIKVLRLIQLQPTFIPWFESVQ